MTPKHPRGLRPPLLSHIEYEHLGLTEQNLLL